VAKVDHNGIQGFPDCGSAQFQNEALGTLVAFHGCIVLTFLRLEGIFSRIFMAEESIEVSATGIPYRMECHRSYLHRYIPADGVWVGLNGHGKIILNFYNDSPLLPRKITGETTVDRKKFTSKEPEIILEADAESIRQFEVSVNLSVAAARVLIDNLKSFVKLAEDSGNQSTSK
jgi:hypothetical protein